MSARRTAPGDLGTAVRRFLCDEFAERCPIVVVNIPVTRQSKFVCDMTIKIMQPTALSNPIVAQLVHDTFADYLGTWFGTWPAGEPSDVRKFLNASNTPTIGALVDKYIEQMFASGDILMRSFAPRVDEFLTDMEKSPLQRCVFEQTCYAMLRSGKYARDAPTTVIFGELQAVISSPDSQIVRQAIADRVLSEAFHERAVSTLRDLANAIEADPYSFRDEVAESIALTYGDDGGDVDPDAGAYTV